MHGHRVNMRNPREVQFASSCYFISFTGILKIGRGIIQYIQTGVDPRVSGVLTSFLGYSTV